MSWIAEIAGRAENILNNIDKNAANVIQQTSIRLGEEWSSTKTNITDNKTNIKLNDSNNSLSDLTKINNPSTTLIKPLVKNANNGTDENNETDSSNAKILSLNYREERKENHNLNDDESPSKTNNTNGDLCDESINTHEKIIILDDVTASCDLEDGIYDIKDLKKDNSEGKVQHLENMLKDIIIEKDNLANKVDDLFAKNSIYNNTISELEMNLKKSQQNYMEINEKLGWQSKETEQIRSELDKYRQKAQSTLQIKDKLIEQLKNNSVDNKIHNSRSIQYNENIRELEINNLKEENSIKTNELQDKIDELESKKILIKQLNEKIFDIKSKSQDTVISLTNRLKLEQEKSIQLELQMKVINQEIYAMRQEFNRQSQSFSSELHQKEKEILLLQSKASKNTEITELNSTEGKIKSLTKVLFEKQAAIETITVEKTALKLQLEKAQEQLHYVISINRPQRTQIINVNDTDDIKLQLPLIMKETPFDTQVARRVKRAYTSFDSAGIRIGVFLRRYPLVRIMVFVYVALLHIWVMFVLLSSTPT